MGRFAYLFGFAFLATAAHAAAPALPQVYLDTHYILPTGQSIVVNAGGDLQAAIDSAHPGDEIVLQAGARFVGNFVLRHKTGTGWITIRSSSLSTLPEGTRATPAQVAAMATLSSPNVAPALDAESSAGFWRIAGLELTVEPTLPSNLNYSLVLGYLGNGQETLVTMPTDIIFDRNWIHGTAGCECKRGVTFNGKRLAVIDSSISDIHVEGQDTQAIGGWNGPGPFKIVNNFIEAATENVMFGGSPPFVQGLIPSDIEIRHNHFFKPLSWNPSDPSYAGINWTVKNLLELKNGQRVLIEGNVFENSWVAGQHHALVFTVRTEGAAAPWNAVQDITVRDNLLTNVCGGVNMLGQDDNGNGAPGFAGRIAVYDNIFQILPSPGYPVWQVLSQMVDVTFNHNTVVGSTQDAIVALDGLPSPGFVMTNNLMPHGLYGIFGSGMSEGTASLAQFAPDATVLSNVLAGIDLAYQIYYPATAVKILHDLSDIGYVNLPVDLHLASSSPYKNAGTDGKDLGADIDAVLAATQGVTAGSPGPVFTPAGPITVTAGPSVVAVYSTSATLTWTTNVPADSLLGIGHDDGTGNVANADYSTAIAYSPVLTLVHTITVTGLYPGMAYGAAALAGQGQLPTPLSPPVLFKTFALDPSAPDSFKVDFSGTHHVAAGFDSMISFSRVTLAGNSPNQASLSYTLPPGVHLTYPQSWINVCISCSSSPSGSQSCDLYGSCSWGGDFVLISADAGAAPGTYNIPFTMKTDSGASYSVNWPVIVDPAPQALPRTPILKVPAIDSTTLSLWQKTMTGEIAQDLCSGTEILWTGYIPYTSGSNVWFYDGIRVYNQIAAYTGNNSWYPCADKVMAMYRDQFVIPDDGKIQFYEVFSQGLRMHYQRTGDPKSLSAVQMLGDNNAYLAFNPSALVPALMRETAYGGQAGMDAHLLGDPAMDPPYFGPGTLPRWQMNIDALLGQFDQAMEAGPWGTVEIEPFMVGLAFETLIQYYQYTKDPRIPPAIKKMADWLWVNAWAPSASSFVYDIFQGPNPAMQNLNPLIVSAYAWLWGMTGDPKYLCQADQIFYAGVVLGHDEIGEGKQFSQSYRSSFDYVKWRTNPDSVFDGPPPPTSPNSATTVTPGTFSPQIYPNPWRSDKHAGKQITFAQLVIGGTIKIFTMSGHEAKEIPVTATSMPWDLTNDKGDKVGSGVYLYLITDGQGHKAKGKVAVIK